MNYSIEWDNKALDFLEKLPKNISERILKRVDLIKENPFRYLEHYEGDKLYKLRIGDYRALIDINFQSKIITIQILDKRGRIYKR